MQIRYQVLLNNVANGQKKEAIGMVNEVNFPPSHTIQKHETESFRRNTLQHLKHFSIYVT